MRWSLLFLLSAYVSTASCSHEQADSPDAELEVELADLVARYESLVVIDAHNHEGLVYESSMATWNAYSIDKVVLFGPILANPQTKLDDAHTLEAAAAYPQRLIPFYAGLNVLDDACVDDMIAGFKKGFQGVGEVVGASPGNNKSWVYAPRLPLDGHFGDVYAACGQFSRPIMLHLEPPDSMVMGSFRQALATYPQTKFVFAHANAYTDPELLEGLLVDFSNVYIDFCAGFTAFDPHSAHTLEDFVPLIEKHHERVMISSDSGNGIGRLRAYLGMYRLLDRVSAETREWISHRTVESILPAVVQPGP